MVRVPGEGDGGAAAAAAPRSPGTDRGGLSRLFLDSSADRPPLRIGLLVDGDKLPRHFAEVVDDIRASNFADVVLVVENGEARRREVAPAPGFRSVVGSLVRYAKDAELRRRFAYRLYGRRAHARNADDPESLVDSRDAFSGAARMVAMPVRTRFVHRFSEADLERIRAAELDVLLRFGFNILRGGILEAARFGVWSYHHGDNDRFRGGPPGLWQLIERADSTGVLLQRLSDELDDGLVLCKSTFRTSPSLWVQENRYLPYWGGVHFVIRKLHELHVHGWDWLASHAVGRGPYQGRRRIYRAPGNDEVASWLLPEVARKVVRPLRREGTETRWRIGLRAAGASTFLDDGDVAGFRLLEPPRGHYWADPMLLQRDGRTWLFFEDYVRAPERGVIRVAEVRPDGAVGPSQVCLDVPCHLSYPHVVEDGGSVFMIPESSGDREVVLYRAVRFPYEWKRKRVLLSGLHAVDTTLVRHEGRWWMFTAVGERPGGEVELLLYFSDSLFGPWSLHPESPVCSNVLLSRGAGAFIHHGVKLIRPSQRCAPRYGYGLVFNEVTTMNPRQYRERVLRSISAAWAPRLIGPHSYAAAGGFEAIDACDFVVRSEM